jgi:hypothetical protein
VRLLVQRLPCVWRICVFNKISLESKYFVMKEPKFISISKSFRTGRLERELQMIQLSATRSSCISILWVGIVCFAAITPLCCFSTSNTKGKRIFSYRLSSETFGYTVLIYLWIYVIERIFSQAIVTCLYAYQTGSILNTDYQSWGPCRCYNYI